MLVYNDKEYKNPFTTDEEYMVEINSPLPLDVFINKLKNKENTTDVATVTVYKIEGKHKEKFDFAKDGKPKDISLNLFDENQVQAAREQYNSNYTRHPQFREFERFRFGQCNKFAEVTMTDEELYHELLLDRGALPTLINDEELSPKDIIALSKDGETLIKKFNYTDEWDEDGLDEDCIEGIAPSDNNPYPTKEIILAYESLNSQEKRLIDSGVKNKQEALQRLIKARETNSHAPLTPEIYYDETNELTISEEEEQLMQDEFQRQHHFTPRIAKEYIAGVLRMGLYKTIEVAVAHFDRKGVQAANLAQTKNPVLIALSSKIKFTELPKDTINFISAFVSKDMLKKLEKKDFSNWLNTHKDISINDLRSCICASLENKIDKFNENPKTLLRLAKNKKAMNDIKEYQNSHYSVFGKPLDFDKNEVAIRGRNIKVYHKAKELERVLRVLPADDLKNLTVGYDTCCCQHCGSVGTSCTFHAITDPFSAILVYEENGKVRAQSYIWADEINDCLVLDNIEYAGGNDRSDKIWSSKIKPFLNLWVNAMPYKNVHVGTGCNHTANGWGLATKTTSKKYGDVVDPIMPNTYGTRATYSDYHRNSARALKINGDVILQKGEEYNPTITVENNPDEPTRWDKFLTPEYVTALNRPMPYEEKIAFVEGFNSLSEEELKTMISRDKEIMSLVKEPSRDFQIWFATTYPDSLQYVNNPVEEVKNMRLMREPEYIYEIENPTDQQIGYAIEKMPALIFKYPDTTEENYVKAIKVVPPYIAEIPPEKITREMERIAIEDNPDIIKSYNASPDMQLLALNYNGNLLREIDQTLLTQEAKIRLIHRNPSFIFDMKPCIYENQTEEDAENNQKELWHEAVKTNGLLIRNCARSYPEFRMDAIENNPYAVCHIPDVTTEELRKAAEAEPNIYNLISVKNADLKAECYEIVKNDERFKPTLKFTDFCAIQNERLEAQMVEI